MNNTQEKYDGLKKSLSELGSVAVAFSGGVDSTFLLRVAHDALGDKVTAVTISSCLFPEREFNEARAFCEENGVAQVVCRSDELEIEGFRHNPKNRCYLCKRDLFGRILQIAKERGIDAVAEGSNVDDGRDYRPGMVAIEELGVKSPLRDAGLTKKEIRQLSWELGLPTWEKPSFACLASRFVYGEEITEEKIRMVDRAEQFLLDLGFRQVRVRVHGNLARIEVLPGELAYIVEDGNRIRIYQEFRSLGFSYVALDMEGYRAGSMNETLPFTPER